jgi:hypothetical protein
MRAEELTQIVRRQPFVPFRLFLTDGRTYDIRHPEFIWVQRARVDVALDPDPKTGVIDRVDFLSLLHIVRVEDIEASKTRRKSNGKG